MDHAPMAFALANNEFYEPLERGDDRSRHWRPSAVPQGWSDLRQDVWRIWGHPGTALSEQGWKIHVSTTLPGAQQVLDEVAPACFAAQAPFKHLASELAFIFVHHKHAVRAQSGKFCAIYPPDQAAAQRLLDELADRLRGTEGPYILSDRRYRDSSTVHYRYGGFRLTRRVRPDGTIADLIRDGTGQLVEDVRATRFVLPAGVTDPFAPASPAAWTGALPGGSPSGSPSTSTGAETPTATASGQGGVRIGDYLVHRALAQSNAGGAYRAVAPDGTAVFMKEARAHHGLDWDASTAQQRLRREHRVLTELHALAPGLAPEPLDYLREWEHEFLVTELVAGQSLGSYVARHNPYIQASEDTDLATYFNTCRQLLEQLRRVSDRLHDLGYRFGDLNPRNVMVTDSGQIRLIDFESCNRIDEPPIAMGVPGFSPVDEAQWEGTRADEYGFSAIAFTMVLPVHQFALRNPAMLEHLHADARRQAGPVPPDLWRIATTNFTSTADAVGPDVTRMPTVAEVAADPAGWLRWLRDAICLDLSATCDPQDPYRIWPTVPQGHLTNPLCVAYGAAGVLHALHHAGRPVDQGAIARFRRESLADQRRPIPDGLHFGTAGIGWVLAELGYLDEAVDLVSAAAARQTPPGDDTAAADGSWGTGSSGIGTALLAMAARTGDPRLREQAVRIGERLAAAADLAPLIGAGNPTGLLRGRSGIALFFYHLWQATGEDAYLRRGTAVLHEELDRAVPMPAGELGFHDDDSSPRVMAYLGTGSAGVAHVLSRYAEAGGDERLVGALPGVLEYAGKLLTVEAGLYQGLAGLVFAYADHAGFTGRPGATERAEHLATGLFKYATPGRAGRVRFLGEAALRFSTELWSGSSGVLLALNRLIDGDTGQFFSLDHLLPDRTRPSASRVGSDPAAVR